MNETKYYLLINFLLTTIIISLIIFIKNERKKLKYFLTVLNEMQSGGSNVKIFVHSRGLISKIGYETNHIISNYKDQIVELKKSELSNKQLLASLSHDVRTPLTSLLGYLDAVYDGVVSDDEKAEYIKIARNKAYSLKDFVDTIFEWSKLNSKEKTFNFEALDVNEYTRKVIIGWLPIFEQKNIQLHIGISEDDLFLNLDKNAYTRIINNLIQNVVSHSEGNYIGIEIEPCNYEVFIKITDNGKGISETRLPFVFERLYKCDDARSYQGSGLGLAITKELVTAHNGKITVTSTPNEKTTFTVSFPLESSV